ncbi:hypothetical protein AS29_000680 [Bacillus sp. SJS]|nr:hypothetical protein AS29_000680 [Bacillus sp. SJS]
MIYGDGVLLWADIGQPIDRSAIILLYRLLFYFIVYYLNISAEILIYRLFNKYPHKKKIER